ncbi:DNA-DIRECTED RNA polymerase IV SUBUNIT 1 [Salix purpurea]|uniref:DNA-directed RNA polymerase n=1 Tax=Salix purpurea TaxID=77065 RepID=A0A9Q0QFD2_SALPP|nr:DNA-DIRECTED RNA polymerase IV SUBUNIT 1 [Salix purpurea]
MVDFRGVANKLSLQVVDCLKTSKLNSDKSANIDPLTADQPKKSNDYVNNASGLRWIEDVVLGKQNDRSFRMVIVGDPNLHLHEIGMPCHIAGRLQDSESLTAWNWEKLSACFENDVFLSSFELQQLYMFHPGRFGYGTLMVTYFKALEDIAMARAGSKLRQSAEIGAAWHLSRLATCTGFFVLQNASSALMCWLE